jgi:hypothetical protein
MLACELGALVFEQEYASTKAPLQRRSEIDKAPSETIQGFGQRRLISGQCARFQVEVSHASVAIQAELVV